MVERKRFLDSMVALKNDLLEMAALAQQHLNEATKAAKQRDVELARQVIAKDELVNNYEIKIEEECIRLLATQQPLASDLRMLTAILKINNDLERIADHAVNIAQSVEKIADKPPVKPLISIPRMTEIVQEML